MSAEAGCAAWSRRRGTAARLLAVATLPALCLGSSACGADRGHEASTVRAAVAAQRPGADMGDGDGPDGTSGRFDQDDPKAIDYGHAASPADARAIAALVRRYYADAAVGDGSGACALTYRLLAETLPEEYGQPPGPLYLKGAGTCAAVLAIVFKRFHAQLSQRVTVTRVRVAGNRGRALVTFQALPTGVIAVRRERGAWKIDGLLASPLP